jgi:hypothetical protein
MRSARSGPTWLQNPIAKTRLAQLGSLFMEQGMLPARDKYLCPLPRWLDVTLAAVEEAEQRRLIEAAAVPARPKSLTERCTLRRKHARRSGFDVTGQLGHPKGPELR